VSDSIGSTILFSDMTPDAAWEQRFNDWYHTDHIPVRMELDGWQGVQRYKVRNALDYLVVYDLSSMAVLKTPEYEKIKTAPSAETDWMLKNVGNFTRFIGTEIGRHGDVDAAIRAPLIFVAMFDVPQADEEEFDSWLTDDHVPLLMDCKDWLAVRRFRLPVAEPTRYTRLTIHYLASDAALTSPEREKARNTPVRERLARHEWFGRGRYRAFDAFGERYIGRP
jgi:hypothetical protein